MFTQIRREDSPMSLPTSAQPYNGNPMTAAELAEGVAAYVETHRGYANMSKHDVAVAAVRVLTDNEAAARDFIDIVGIGPWATDEG